MFLKDWYFTSLCWLSVPADSPSSSNYRKNRWSDFPCLAANQKTALCSCFWKPPRNSRSYFGCRKNRTDIWLCFLSISSLLWFFIYSAAYFIFVQPQKTVHRTAWIYYYLPFSPLRNRQKTKIPLCTADIRVVHWVIVLNEIMTFGRFNHFATLERSDFFSFCLSCDRFGLCKISTGHHSLLCGINIFFTCQVFCYVLS